MGWGNILDSSLFTGAGTPWGAPTNQMPGDPKYKTDPNEMAGFDYGPMKKAMVQNIREARARRDQNSRAGLLGANPYGGGQGSAAQRAYGQSGVQAEADIASGMAALDKQAYDEKVAAMQQYNQALQNEYNMALQKAWREQDQRAGFYNKVGNVLSAGMSGG